MSGFDLILSSALCLTCVLPDLYQVLPEGFIRPNADGSFGEIATNLTNIDPSLENAPKETLASIRQKQIKLQGLRDWINGRHLRIATLQDYPLSYTETLQNGTLVGRGVAFELIDFLCAKYKFTYEVIVPEANIIGSTTDFDSSLVQMLNESKVDLAAAFIPFLSDQRSYIYYSTTTLDEGEWIMVMQRPRESATGSGLMAPFDFWVWILIFVSFLAVGPIIYLLIILRNRLTGDTDQKPYSLGHCAWFVYGALMKQGSTLSPVADSTRLLFATWWIFITILTSFYTANLTAFLTLSKFTLPFNTVSDILYKNKHFVSARGGGVEYAIRNTNESLSMLNTMINNNRAVFSQNTNDSYNLQNFVEKESFVFVRDRPAINHALYLDYRYRKTISVHNEKVHCPFAMAKTPFLKKNRSFAYPIGSNLSELLDPELLNLVESGIIKHLSAKDLPNAEICPQDLGGTERQLRNGDLMMTYYIMMAGFVTSIVVFTTELIFRYVNSRQDASKWARHGIGRTPNGGLSYPTSMHWRLGRNSNNSGTDKQRLTSPHVNVTPPPPYQSIFSGSQHNNYGSNILPTWRRNADRVDATRLGGAAAAAAAGLGGVAGVFLGGGGRGSHAVDKQKANPDISGVRRMINGRDYIVFRNPDGQSQLVPVRAPSAALFQYTYTE